MIGGEVRVRAGVTFPGSTRLIRIRYTFFERVLDFWAAAPPSLLLSPVARNTCSSGRALSASSIHFVAIIIIPKRTFLPSLLGNRISTAQYFRPFLFITMRSISILVTGVQYSPHMYIALFKKYKAGQGKTCPNTVLRRATTQTSGTRRPSWIFWGATNGIVTLLHVQSVAAL